jgi:hypothetical protein
VTLGDRPASSRHRLRIAGFGLLAVLLLGVLAAGWVALRLGQARGAADAARAAGERTRTAVLAGDQTRARAGLAEARRHAGRARAGVSDPVYGVAARLPFVGDDLRAVRTVVRAVDDVTSGVLAPVVDVGGSVRPSALRLRDGRIDLAPLVNAQRPLAGAAASAAQARDDVAAIERDGLTGRVERGVADAGAALTDLARTSSQASAAVELVPQLLGGQGRRRYFLAFQNSAEARGTGGLLGAYGIVEADRGRLRLLRLGSNNELRPVDRMPVDLGPDFEVLYNDDPALWVNSNLSPHFPYAAQIWLALWRKQTGERLDGVIATDPTALSYVLRATGPVRLPNGEQVTAANAVPLTLREVYARFPSRFAADNLRRDAFLQQIAGAVFRKLVTFNGDGRVLADALGKAATERRLLVYSAAEAVQARLATTAVAGVVSERPGPFAAVAVNNGAGSKLDYYLGRSLTYTTMRCEPRERSTRIAVQLTNSAPRRGLPEYVTLRVDRPGLTGGRGEPPGTNVSIVQVYGAVGAELVAARLDGRPLLVTVGRERSHPVFRRG